MWDEREWHSTLETWCPAGHCIRFTGHLGYAHNQQALAVLLAFHSQCRPPSVETVTIEPHKLLTEAPRQ